MKMNFNEWKESITKERETRYIRRGDIYWYYLEDNGSHKQSGKHPILIISNDKGNQHSTILSAVGISSQMQKKKLPTHVSIEPTVENGLTKSSFIQTEQIFPVDKFKLLGKLGHIEIDEEINKAIEISLGLRPIPTCLENILSNKVKHLKELDFIIGSILDKNDNVIDNFTQKFISERHDLLQDIKNICKENGVNFAKYYSVTDNMVAI